MCAWVCVCVCVRVCVCMYAGPSSPLARVWCTRARPRSSPSHSATTRRSPGTSNINVYMRVHAHKRKHLYVCMHVHNTHANQQKHTRTCGALTCKQTHSATARRSQGTSSIYMYMQYMTYHACTCPQTQAPIRLHACECEQKHTYTCTCITCQPTETNLGTWHANKHTPIRVHA
jgi:hypothetical protein